jgi:hypothetical protein
MTKYDVQRKLNGLALGFEHGVKRDLKDILDNVDLNLESRDEDDYTVAIMVMVAYCNKFAIEHSPTTSDEKKISKAILKYIMGRV